MASDLTGSSSWKSGKMIELDLKGLKCPLPVLKTRKAMAALSAGEKISVTTTDPLAAIDVPAFCNEHGHRLVDTEENEGSLTFIIEKAG